MPKNDPSPRQIIRRERQRYAIARQHSDMKLAHLAGDRREHVVPVLERHAERGVAAPLHEGAVAAAALFEHAAEAVGAEFEIVVTAGTARRPAVGDQRAACSGAIRANCGTPSGCDGDLEACRPPGRAWGRTRANDRTGTWRCAAPPPVPRRTARGTSSLPGSR